MIEAEAPAEWEGVGKHYPGPEGGVWAVRGIDLRVEAGEVVGLLGPNRSGKTTLAKLLLTLCRPTEGRVRRFGRPASSRATLSRVGFVHEDPAFPLDVTATRLLHDYGALGLIPASTLRRRVPGLLERVGLADRAREPIGRFSKGMLRRLGLAQALLGEPRLLVLDEPIEGLDLEGRRLVREVVLELRSRGSSVLLISHATAEVERLCDRAAVLAGGRKVYDGPLDDLTRGGSLTLEQSIAEIEEAVAA